MAERTCLACRKTLQKNRLVRYVVAPDGMILVDYSARLPGRGAYTCVDLDCLTQAVQRKQFDRAFKGANQSPEVGVLEAELCDAVWQKVQSLLGMARKSGQIISGTSEVQNALKSRVLPALVIVTKDLGDAIAKKIVPLAEQKVVPVYRLFDKDSLGAVLGKGVRSAVAIPQGSFAEPLKEELDRYQTVLGES